MQALDPLTAQLFAQLTPFPAARGHGPWERLAAVATAHRLGPMLAAAWRNERSPAELPPALRANLERQYLAAAARAERLNAELERVLALAAARGIEALPIRGPRLAHALYPDAAVRQSDDLDLLVPRADLPRLRDALVAEGYAVLNAAPPALEPRRLAAGGACVLQRPGTTYQIDLAWTLFAPQIAAPLTLAALAPLRDAALGLSREAWLVLLCAHGGKHLWSRHAWTLDVARLLATWTNLDWPATLALARDWGFARWLRLGLAWCRHTCDAPLPAAAGDAIARDPAVPQLVDALVARFARDPAWIPGDDAGRAWLQLRARERARDRVRYVWRRTFEPGPNDWRTCPLPAAAWPLYRVLRPLRLVARALSPGLASRPPSPSPRAADGG